MPTDMRIYLDMCCFNRPYDDQTQTRIHLEAERFLIAVNQDKFNYTEWRRSGLPDMSIVKIAAAANQFSSQLNQS